MYGMYVSKKLICKDNKKRRLVDTKFLGDWSDINCSHNRLSISFKYGDFFFRLVGELSLIVKSNLVVVCVKLIEK